MLNELSENKLGILSSKKNQDIDFGLKFQKNPLTKGLVVRKDASAISQALKNLILTNYFDRPFSPRYGGNIHAELFEPLDRMSTSILEDSLQRTVETYEKRVQNVSIKVVPLFGSRAVDQNKIQISVEYSVPASSERFSTDFKIERIR